MVTKLEKGGIKRHYKGKMLPAIQAPSFSRKFYVIAKVFSAGIVNMHACSAWTSIIISMMMFTLHLCHKEPSGYSYYYVQSIFVNGAWIYSNSPVHYIISSLKISNKH